MYRKLLSAILCLTMLVPVLTACGGGQNQKRTTASSQGVQQPDTSVDSSSTAEASWPCGTITWLVGASAGGSTDLNTRALTIHSSAYFKDSIVIDCINGGGGTVMMTQLKDEPADGSVIATLAVGSTLIKPWQMELSYTPEDFTYIAGYTETGYFLTVPASFPADTYEEFCQEVSNHPGKYSYGQGSVGGIGHLITAVMLDAGGIADDCEMIAYDSGGKALVDLVGGHVDFAVLTAAEVSQYVTDGQLKLLTYSGEERSPEFPDIPSYMELGITVIPSCGVICGPADMAPNLVAEIEQMVKAWVEDEKVREAFGNMGALSSLSFKDHETITKSCMELYKNAGVILKQVGLID